MSANKVIKEIVLYCGMADDVLTPLILVPNLSKLFVIDKFDTAFAKNGTWEGQKEDIKRCLSDGNNKNSHHMEVYLFYDKKTKIYYIDKPCKIINESDDGKCWRLEFIYKETKREFIYFHHTNFISTWDKKISKINHLMCMGAEFPIHKDKLNKMIKERCATDCKFYDQFAKFKNTVCKNAIGRHIYINDLSNILKHEKR